VTTIIVALIAVVFVCCSLLIISSSLLGRYDGQTSIATVVCPWQRITKLQTVKCTKQPLYVDSNGTLAGLRRSNVHTNRYGPLATGHWAIVECKI